MELPSPGTGQPTRIVHCEDALHWLRRHTPLVGCSVITGLPDVSGLPQLSLAQWKAWFVDAARCTLAATPDDGVTIFCQADIKVDGTWVDKSFLCHQAAVRDGAALLWHKIVCRQPAGEATFGRPGYSHLLCYSRGIRDVIAKGSDADVLPTAGEMTWSRAMGVEVCDFACRYVQSRTTSRTIVDPFCGRGTVLAVANQRGLHAVGVEIGKRRAHRARGLRIR